MIPQFGFSIGDFIELSKIVKDVYDCARAYPKLKAEVETLTGHYKKLYNSMGIILLQSQEDNVEEHLDAINGMKLHIDRCNDHLKTFRSNTICVTDGSAASFGKRLMFLPYRTKTFKDLNQKFGEDVEAFKLLVEAVTSERLKTIVTSSRSLNSKFEGFMAIFERIPKDLGYTWEGGNWKQHVTLVHASGQKQLIPLDCCETFENFHRFLLIMDYYPGRKRIGRRHYWMMDYSNGRKIDLNNADKWKAVVCGGSTIGPIVYVGTTCRSSSTNEACPRCYGTTIEHDIFTSWYRCTECEMHWDQLPIKKWTFRDEPIDNFTWDWPDDSSSESQLIQHKQQKSDIVEDHAVECDSQMQLVTPNPASRQRPDDWENSLKRVSLVYAPIFNFVFRSMFCRCRLEGDESPFAPDFDFAWASPCRLHFFDGAQELGVNLVKPDEGYDPEKDPYFDQFGGHLAFALFASCNSVVKRSLDIHKLLPVCRLKKAKSALEAAWRIDEQKAALLEWQAEVAKDYFEFRERYGEEQKRFFEKIRARECSTKKSRRGSF